MLSDYKDRVIALINDDSNEVGSARLGVVHLWELSVPTVSNKEEMITNMSFMTLDELVGIQGELETWSQICLGYIKEVNGVKT